MKKVLIVGLGVWLVMGGCMNIQVKENQFKQVDRCGQVLRHVVLFAFKADSSPSDIRKIENDFAALPSKVETVYDFEWGTDVSVENLAQGYTHCFVVTFRSEEGRADYLPHPAHQEFGALLKPHLEKVLVVDYWTKE